jgi:hypothetical protein
MMANLPKIWVAWFELDFSYLVRLTVLSVTHFIALNNKMISEYRIGKDA